MIPLKAFIRPLVLLVCLTGQASTVDLSEEHDGSAPDLRSKQRHLESIA